MQITTHSQDVNSTNSNTLPVPNLAAMLDGNLPSDMPNMPAADATVFVATDDTATTATNGFAELGLAMPILRSIEKTGYTIPTPIQAQAIPAALAGRDLLLSAQTGSGKTAAFVLPILHKIAESKSKNRVVRAMILTPTRELAYQVSESIRNYGAGLKDIFCVPLVGGAPYTGQIRALKKGVQIIVATPGRLLDHMSDNRIDLSELSILVLDEADRMLDMGFADDINRILEATPENRQTIMSSATWDGPVGKIAANFTTNPERIAIKVESAHIDEKVYFCDDFNHKNKLLEQLVCDKDMHQAIIFTATKRSSEQLAERLSEWGHSACYLHGDLPQSKRNRIVADLKAGKYDILVATDVAARGIDVPKISHVVNYDLPRQVEDYVHRIGRSGRAGRTGIAINLCSRDDRAQYHAINRYLKRDMTEATVEGLEPRFIESAYDRSSKGNRGGRSQNGGQNRNRGGQSNGYSNSGGRDKKYSGFKGDANKSGSGFSRAAGQRDAGQNDAFKPRGERSEGRDRNDRPSNRSGGYHAGSQNRDHNANGKMLTSHEFNFDTRKGRDDQPRKSAQGYDKPARSHRTGESQFSNERSNSYANRASRDGGARQSGDARNEFKKPYGEKRHSGERSNERRSEYRTESRTEYSSERASTHSYDSAKPKRFTVESTGANKPKSHNSRGFEGRQYEKGRTQSSDSRTDRHDTAGSQDRPRFAKSGNEGFKKAGFQNAAGKRSSFGENNSRGNGDGQQAVRRSSKFAQKRDSTGKPI